MVDNQEITISAYRENVVELNSANVYGVGVNKLCFFLEWY